MGEQGAEGGPCWLTKQLKKLQKHLLKIIGKESLEMQMKKLYIVMGAIITPETEPNTKAALGRCGEMEMEQDAWGPLIGI